MVRARVINCVCSMQTGTMSCTLLTATLTHSMYDRIGVMNARMRGQSDFTASVRYGSLRDPLGM